MIRKPFDQARPRDPRLLIGWEAEEQVAFQLRRKYELDGRVHVYHNLRFEVAAEYRDFCEIDHLVLHRWGFIIIESKGTGRGGGEFIVDAAEQWQRRAGKNAPENIESPITQAKRQVDALRKALASVDPPLLGKRMGLIQGSFTNVPFTPFVAISNAARLTGPGAAKLTTAMKSDRLVDAIEAEMREQERRGKVSFRDDTLVRLAEHVDTMHVPLLRPKAASQAPTLPAVPAPAAGPSPGTTGNAVHEPEALTCGKCRSIRVSLVFRRDYCLLCAECQGYTPLARGCTRCGLEATIRKRGPEFSRVCDRAGGCGAVVVFHDAAG